VSFVWDSDRAAKEALDNTVRRVNASLAPPPKGSPTKPAATVK
jgi:hypothetical protein